MVISKSLRNFIIQLFTGPRFYLGGGAKTNALYDNPAFQATIQSQLNADALKQSRFNQTGPQGSTTWNGNTQTTTLSPEQQRLYDSSTANQNRISDFTGQQAGQYGDILRQQISGGDMAQRQRVEDAMMARLQPSLDRDQNQLAQSLANQGLAPGSEAYTNAMQDQSRRVNDARLGVIGQGTQEMMATQGMANNQRNQAMSENAGLMQQAGNAQVPAYSGAPMQQTPVNVAQMFQNYGNNQNNAQQAKQASKNGMMSSGAGALGTIGAAAMMSDRRLKENIVKIGTTKHGLNLYHFNYIRDPHTRYEGVMADEVKDVMPEAVRTGNDGFMSVDYGMLGLKMREV